MANTLHLTSLILEAMMRLAWQLKQVIRNELVTSGVTWGSPQECKEGTLVCGGNSHRVHSKQGVKPGNDDSDMPFKSLRAAIDHWLERALVRLPILVVHWQSINSLSESQQGKSHCSFCKGDLLMLGCVSSRTQCELQLHESYIRRLLLSA